MRVCVEIRLRLFDNVYFYVWTCIDIGSSIADFTLPKKSFSKANSKRIMISDLANLTQNSDESSSFLEGEHILSTVEW